MELILGYELLESYKRLPYKPWYALAEFIDNSTQSYRNNRERLDAIYEDEGETTLAVKISYLNKGVESFIEIEDNAFGMNEIELQNALTLGKRPAISNQRSKYGLGLKTAAFWFGNKWRIETTQFGSDTLLVIEVDLNNILKEEKLHYQALKDRQLAHTQFKPNLKIQKIPCTKSKHGTKLFISDLGKRLTPQVASNCKEYLQSIYRIDLKNSNLILTFQNEPLVWNESYIDGLLLKDPFGEKYKRSFKFTINEKEVSGWAGILAKGSRRLAGFSLLQAERVIVGFPNSYKNKSLFGQVEGSNDLVNQRLVGEISLDENFAVSHTKDQILFSDDEEELLDEKLFEEFADYKREASIPFKNRINNEPDLEVNDFDFAEATDFVVKIFKSSKFQDTILRASVLPKEIIEITNSETIERLLREEFNSYEFDIDEIKVKIILSENSSPYDPYLIVKPAGGKSALVIVININHPYWVELGDNTSRFHFLLNCVYDGVSEWKAEFLLSQLDPDTVKMIKDSLLRLPLVMEYKK